MAPASRNAAVFMSASKNGSCKSAVAGARNRRASAASPSPRAHNTRAAGMEIPSAAVSAATLLGSAAATIHFIVVIYDVLLLHPDPMTPAPEATRPSAWLAFRQSVLHFDTAKMNPWIGLRNALGMALPLFGGIALHSLAGGVGAALGALNVAFRDSDAPYLQRARHMLLTSVLTGIAVFAGSVGGSYPPLAVILAGAWALVAGMLISLSVSASELGVLSLVLLLIYSAVPQDPGHAALSGLYAFCGGLLQTLLSLALWPLHRYRPERRALADLYQELSRAAVSPPGQADDAPAATGASIQAQISLATLDSARSIESERFRFLLSQAERI